LITEMSFVLDGTLWTLVAGLSITVLYLLRHVHRLEARLGSTASNSPLTPHLNKRLASQLEAAGLGATHLSVEWQSLLVAVSDSYRAHEAAAEAAVGGVRAPLGRIARTRRTDAAVQHPAH